jgi:CBS domain-containing protein
MVPRSGPRHDVQMSKIKIDDAEGLSVRDILHAKWSALEATATVADARDYFAASGSRRMALVCDDGRYVGALTPAQLAGDLDADLPLAEVAERGPTVTPDDPATTGRDVALQTDARRVPVIDADGRLVGVVAVTGDLTSFCGTNADWTPAAKTQA